MSFDIKELFPTDNAVFSGGFGLAIIAAGAQIGRSGYQIILRLARRHFLVTLEVTSKDRAYPWVLNWLSIQPGARTQHLSVETTLRPAMAGSQAAFNLVPGPGVHLLRFENNFILVSRTREQQMLDLNSGKPWERVMFTSIGRNTSIFQRLLSDAYSLSMQQEEGKTLIYTNWGSEWRQFGQPRRKRSLESVVLDDGISEKLYCDVQDWINSSKWYSDRGIPYRRGYLLHGPPGSGKTSFIYALAGKLDYNICILNLNERGLTDDRLALALSCVPPQSIVLLEDIDAAFPSRSERSSESHSDVTFSGLLNVLDGVAASEERLVFMTTNHIDRLDPALIRPGRVDYNQRIGDATDYQVQMLFQKFYPDTSTDQSDLFLTKLRAQSTQISMASLQGYMLRNKNDPIKAIENLSTYAFNIDSRRNSSNSNKLEEKKDMNTDEGANRHINKATIKPRPVRALTPTEVDKMFFNPQADWDKNL